MKTNEIQFGGKSYVCRIVEANDGEELLIAPTTLLDALQPGSFNDENEGFASKEAESIYDEVHCCPEKFYHSVSCLGPLPSGTLAVRSV